MIVCERERMCVCACVCVFDFHSLGSESSEAESLELSADLVPKVTIGSVYGRWAVCVSLTDSAGKTFSREHNRNRECVHMCEHTNCHIYTHANKNTHARTHTHTLPCAVCLPETNSVEQMVRWGGMRNITINNIRFLLLTVQIERHTCRLTDDRQTDK